MMKPFHLLILLMLTSPRHCKKTLFDVSKINQKINKGIFNVSFPEPIENLTHKQAERFCAEQGPKYFLAMPKTQAEANEMYKAIEDLRPLTSRVIWIGLKRKGNTRTSYNFTYTDGTLNTSFGLWQPVYGVNGLKYWPKNKERNCVEWRKIWFSGPFSEEPAWNFEGWQDRECDRQRVFLCQYVANAAVWSSWVSGRCSRSCGLGQLTMSRECLPGQGTCRGETTETSKCQYEECPAASWGSWTRGTCGATCGPGRLTRTRTCQGSGNCPGSNTDDSLYCKQRPCSVSTWGPWKSGTCSVTCGPGKKKRTRTCQGGSNCAGSSTERLDCFLRACPATPACSVNNGGCSHSCVEGSHGHYHCRCPRGFRLGEDGKTCQEPREPIEDNELPGFNEKPLTKQPDTGSIPATTGAPKDDDMIMVFIVIIVGGVVGLVLTVLACYCMNKCCFSPKRPGINANEGGSSGKVPYSKNSSQKELKYLTSKGGPRSKADSQSTSYSGSTSYAGSSQSGTTESSSS